MRKTQTPVVGVDDTDIVKVGLCLQAEDADEDKILLTNHRT